MSFGEMLQQLRESRGLTQRDLAVPGLSRVLISHYEHGRRVPTYNHIQYLAERLNVATDVFFGGRANDVAMSAMLECINQGEKAGDRQAWADAAALWEQARLLAATFHFEDWVPEIQWRQMLASYYQEDWPLVVEYGLLLLAHGHWGTGGDQRYRLMWMLAGAYRSLDQIHTAQVFYKLAQEEANAHSEKSLRMILNRASCAMYLGNMDEAQRLFDYARHEAATVGLGLVEAWAHIGWTTAIFGQGTDTNAEQALDRAESLAKGLQDPDLIAAVTQNRGVYARIRGDWDALDALFQQVAASVWPVPVSLITERLYWCTAQERWEEGESRIRTISEHRGGPSEVSQFWVAVAHFYEAQSKPDFARVARAIGNVKTLSLADSFGIYFTLRGGSND